MVAAIAQWIRLRQPSYGAGFESQAQYLCFPFCNLNLNCIVKRTKVDKKMPRLAHRYLKKKGIERSKRIKLKRKDEHLRWKVAHWSSIRSWERWSTVRVTSSTPSAPSFEVIKNEIQESPFKTWQITAHLMLLKIVNLPPVGYWSTFVLGEEPIGTCDIKWF